MNLRITLTYFDGRHADSQIIRDLTREEAQERQDLLMSTIRQAIATEVPFTLLGKEVSFGYPPGLLNQTHIKFEIIEE